MKFTQLFKLNTTKLNRKLSALIFVSSVAITSLVGCKTTAQVEQEQKVQGISGQLQENQKLQGDLLGRMQGLEQKMAGLNGKIEEIQYNSMPGEKEDIQASMKELEERMGLIEKNLQLVRQEIEANRNFVESVTQTLQGIGKSTPAKADKKKSESSLNTPAKESASDLYKAGKWQEARPLYEQKLADSKFNSKARAEVYHNLGMIYFKNKDFAQAMVLFGKLYKEFPASSYNKNGLLHLAKSLIKTGENEQAKNALALVIEKYPAENQGKEAKKMLSDLK